ncbi:MAG: bifunctional lysylphosphatidylglycerol flippase/synthetase MprF [Woeseia sp.]
MSDKPQASIAGPSPADNKAKHLGAALGAVASVVVFGVALWFLHREMAGLSKAAILDHVTAIPLWTLLASTGFAFCSYLVLIGYDATALRYLNRKVPYGQVALTSFMAYAIGHNVGFVSLSGGSIRYRMYSLAGLGGSEIARLVVFVSATFFIGAAGLLGIALLLMPETQTAIFGLPTLLVKGAGVLLLAVPCVYAALAIMRREPFHFRDWQVAVPQPSIALSQVVVSVIDMMFASATLYILLEPALHIGYFPFLGIYLLALGAGLVSSLPGGIGVFEAVLVAALPQVEPTALLGTIIVYRLVYYVLPLVLALILMVTHEARLHRHVLGPTLSRAGGWFTTLTPKAISVLIFLAGLVLLLSGASPAVESRLALISKALPLPLLEVSHLSGSIIGTGLLILAQGLYRRLHGAYLAALAAIVTGIVVSLIKGLDYEVALILAGAATALWLSREQFYRLESIGDEPFSVRWIAAIVAILIISFWVGLLSFRHVEYADRLWWQFAFSAEAPRFLRASLLAAITALSFALWKSFRSRTKLRVANATIDDIEQARLVVASSMHASANAALIGDKRFLWSADRQAFIMYQVSGRSWIALGDPVGPAEYREELVWAFREIVDQHDGRTVFYEVSDAYLPLYIDLGLTLSKLGEEGRVPLEGFTMQGSQRAELRQADNKAKKNGAVFEVLPRSVVPAITAELRRVSDSWLNDKSTAEKGFSLGAFSEEYLQNFDCAVVRLNGEIVAFANLWPAPAGNELSIDLMRYDQRAPKGVMDYLFVELMLWASANNYRWFCLGMAPLAGLEQRPLAPLWHKLGHLVFSHGENFYNFEGLRSYKEKFDPEWQPRYLACPGGWLNLPAALLDASQLISGGTAAMIARKN